MSKSEYAMGDEAPVPVNISWNQQNGYSMDPPNPHIGKKGSINFNAANQSCTIIFNPSDTVLGPSVNVSTGPPLNVPVGDSNYTVGYCITTLNGTCPAPPPPRLADDNTGTIKVGSGTGDQ